MTSRADLYAIPSTRWVSPSESDVWGVDFANKLAEEETITDATARIVATDSRLEVAEAVVEAVIDGDTETQINVSWTAVDLCPGIAYRLEVVASLSSDAEIPLYVDLIVV